MMFAPPARTLQRLERTCLGVSHLDVVDRAIDTPPAWFDGLDVATSWVLCWVEQVSPGSTRMQALGKLTALTTRASYRTGRLLLRAEHHPDLGPVEQSDALAANLFDLTSEALCSDVLTLTPPCTRQAVAALSQLLQPRWARDLAGANAGDLRRACTLSCATGTTLAIMEHHLAMELSNRK